MSSNSNYGDAWKLCRHTLSATLSKIPGDLRIARQSDPTKWATNPQHSYWQNSPTRFTQSPFFALLT
jgi:hypothetical protein